MLGKSLLKLAGTLVCVLPFVAGCSSSQPRQAETSSAQTNGAIVSKKLITVPGQNRNINIYEVFYMSDGVRDAMYVSEPKQNGSYPLVLSLHGGFVQPESYSHYIDGATPTAQELANTLGDRVTVLPLYRGYGDSNGTIGDLLNDTTDTNNAIEAVKSLGNIAPNKLFITGTSLGGGVALMLASERKDVTAVMVKSPFVGYDADIDWERAHPSDFVDQGEELSWEPIWGKYTPEAKNYTVRSPIDHISTIRAPVLILQGTADTEGIWQTAQEFANDMKKDGKTVKLVLYPGGDHGLTGQYAQDAAQQQIDWFGQYGI